jgi:hypothetical protein
VKAALQEQREKFTSLVKAEYLIRGPEAKEDQQFLMPEINLRDLLDLQEANTTPVVTTKFCGW